MLQLFFIVGWWASCYIPDAPQQAVGWQSIEYMSATHGILAYARQQNLVLY